MRGSDNEIILVHWSWYWTKTLKYWDRLIKRSITFPFFELTGTLLSLSLLMHYMQILEVSREPDPPKVTYKLPYVINLSSSSLFLLSGALCRHNSRCFGAVGVLKPQLSHMDTISSEEIKLSPKPSRKSGHNEADSPPITGDSLATRIYSKSNDIDSRKNWLLPFVLIIYLSRAQDHRCVSWQRKVQRGRFVCVKEKQVGSLLFWLLNYYIGACSPLSLQIYPSGASYSAGIFCCP